MASVAAILAVHNRESLIGRAVESALAAGPDQVIVVDDGSTDGTRAVLDSFGDSLSVVSQENSGASAARNAGVAAASAEWIAFLDSDDTWEPDHLARMRAAIEATEGAAGLYFDDTVLSPARAGKSLWSLAELEPTPPHELVEDGSAWALRARQPMMLQSSVIARAVLAEVGGLAPGLRVREDTHLFFKLSLGRSVCAVAGVGARMTDDGGAGRLTEESWTDTPEYWLATRALYESLLSGGQPLSGIASRELRSRLASAHLRLAKASPAMGAKFLHLTRALFTSPARFGEALQRRLRGASSNRG